MPLMVTRCSSLSQPCSVGSGKYSCAPGAMVARPYSLHGEVQGRRGCAAAVGPQASSRGRVPRPWARRSGSDPHPRGDPHKAGSCLTPRRGGRGAAPHGEAAPATVQRATGLHRHPASAARLSERRVQRREDNEVCSRPAAGCTCPQRNSNETRALPLPAAPRLAHPASEPRRLRAAHVPARWRKCSYALAREVVSTPERKRTASIHSVRSKRCLKNPK
jgi:hypothetical protein